MTDKPNTAKQDARGFERWFNEVSQTWPQELRDLGQRALLSLKMMDQPNLPDVIVRENAKDLLAFREAYAAHTSKG